MGGDGASVYVFGNNGAINGNYHQGVKIEAGQSFTTAGVGVYEVTEVPDQLNPPSGAILGPDGKFYAVSVGNNGWNGFDYLFNSSGNLNIKNSVISNNNYSISLSGTTNIENTLFTQNNGADFLESRGNTNIEGSIFIGKSANVAGLSVNSGTTNLKNSSFADSSISVDSSGVLNAENISVYGGTSDNSISIYNGGTSVYKDSDFRIDYGRFLNYGNLTLDNSNISGTAVKIQNAVAAATVNFKNSGSYTITPSTASATGAVLLGDGQYYTISVTEPGINNLKYDNGTVFYNSGILNLENSVFSNNSNSGSSSSRHGSVVRNTNQLNIVNSLFIDNKTDSQASVYNSSQGGVIYSESFDDVVNVTNSIFSGNKVVSASYYAEGGAIALGALNITNSSFSNNTATGNSGAGGALFLSASKNTISNSMFNNNSAIGTNRGIGGAINAESGTTLTIINTTFASNAAKSTALYEAYGGAIATTGNSTTKVSIKDSIFESNFASSDNDEASGGALYNEYGSYDIENTTFDGNYASGDTAFGGAISFIGGNLKITDSIFRNNKAGGSTEAFGGAIYIKSGVATIIDTSFFNNSAGSYSTAERYGGAIYLGGSGYAPKVSIISKDRDVIFEGNKTYNTSNAITLGPSAATLNLNAGNYSIIFNDSISSYLSSGETASIFINQTGTSTDDSTPNGNNIPTWAGTTGTIVLNADMSGYGSNVYISGGTVRLGESSNAKFFNSNLTFNGGKIDLRNNKFDTVSLKSFIGSGGEAVFDINLETGENDRINATSTNTTNSWININSLNIVADSNAATKTVTLSDRIKLNLGADYAYTNSSKYQLSSPSIGQIKLTKYNDGKAIVYTLDDLKATNISPVTWEMQADTSYSGELRLTQSDITINGNNYAINGPTFMFAANQTMKFNDVGEYSMTEAAAGTDSAILFPDGKYYTVSLLNGGLTHSSNYYGPIYGYESGSSVIFNNSVISNSEIYNDSSYKKGAGIELWTQGSADIKNSLFFKNSVDTGSARAASAYGGAIYIGSSSYAKVENSIFIENNVISSDDSMGGAIYNSGDSSIINSVFHGNTGFGSGGSGEVFGGAIANRQGTQTIINSIFMNNSVDSTAHYANGGAVSNYQGSQTVSDSIFKNNSATSTYNAYGGAIYNDGSGATMATQILTGNVFIGNTATDRGGAVYNWWGQQLIDESLFDGNKVVSDAYAYGGALDNYSGSSGGVQIINNSIFINNTASSTYSAAYTVMGGAVSNNAGVQVITDSQFINNGAICSNSAGGAFGGAIYIGDNATTTLSAQYKDILFEGNYVSSKGSTTKTSNAIHLYRGSSNQPTLNLNASSGHSIIFNDRITNSNGSTNIYINRPGTYDNTDNILKDPTGSNGTPVSAGTKGTIELNEDMSGFFGNIYMYDGTLKLGWDRVNTYGQVVTPKFFDHSSLFDITQGVIDTVNGKVDELGRLRSTNGTFIMDVDLVSGTNDYFPGYISGTLTIGGVNLLTDSGVATQKLEVAGVAPLTLAYTNVYTNNNFYILSHPSSGDIQLTNQMTYSLFRDAFSSDKSNKYYNFSRAEAYGNSGDTLLVGNLGGKYLAVNGNGYSLKTGGYTGNYLGMVVADGQELLLNHFGSYTKTENSAGMLFPDGKKYQLSLDGTTGYGIANSVINDENPHYSVLKNSGTTSITNAVVNNNALQAASFIETGGIILNSGGTLSVSDSYFLANYVNTSNDAYVRGGVFANVNGTLTIKNSVFSGNQAYTSTSTANGGVIYNTTGGILNIDNSVFYENMARTTSSSNGTKAAGVIYINDGQMRITNSVFDKNSSTGYYVTGQAIYNGSYLDQEIVNTVFLMNGNSGTSTIGSGGAIYHDGGKLSITGSSFIQNYQQATSRGSGGAIFINQSQSTTIYNSIFDGNKINSTYAYGGAIGELGTVSGVLKIEDSEFLNNTITAYDYGYGGAIYLNGPLIINNSIFSGNFATSNQTSSGALYGGAISANDGSITIITDSQFLNNNLSGKKTASVMNGGAYYGGSKVKLTLISKDKDVLFDGNYYATSTASSATKYSDGIYIGENSQLNLNAGEHNIIFNDKIQSKDSTAVININAAGTWDDSENSKPDGNYIPTWAPTTGTIELNEDMNNAKGDLNIYGGTLKLGWNTTNKYGQSVTTKFFNTASNTLGRDNRPC